MPVLTDEDLGLSSSTGGLSDADLGLDTAVLPQAPMAEAANAIPRPGYTTPFGQDINRTAQARVQSQPSPQALTAGAFLNQRALEPPPLPGLVESGNFEGFGSIANADPQLYRETLHEAVKQLTPTPETVRSAREFGNVIQSVAFPENPTSLEVAQERLAGPNLPPESIDKAIAGGLGATYRQIESFAQPEQLPLLFAGSVPGKLGQAVTAAFYADMVRHSPEVFNKVVDALQSGDVQQEAEALTDAVIHGAFLGLTGAHTANTVREGVDSFIKNNGPEARRAHYEQMRLAKQKADLAPITQPESFTQPIKPGEPNAIPVRSPETLPMGKSPKDSGEVGTRVPESKAPAETQSGEPSPAQPAETAPSEVPLTLKPAIQAQGQIIEGTPGKTHGDIVTDTLASGDSVKAMAAIAGRSQGSGFVGPDGKFRTRKEAEAQLKEQYGDFELMNPKMGLNSEDLGPNGKPKLLLYPEKTITDSKYDDHAKVYATEQMLKKVQDMSPEKFRKLNEDYKKQTGHGLTQLSYDIGDVIAKSGRYDLVDTFKKAYAKANEDMLKFLTVLEAKAEGMPSGPERDAVLKPAEDLSSHPQFFNEVVQRAEWIKSGGVEHAGRFKGETVPEWSKQAEAPAAEKAIGPSLVSKEQILTDLSERLGLKRHEQAQALLDQPDSTKAAKIWLQEGFNLQHWRNLAQEVGGSPEDAYNKTLAVAIDTINQAKRASGISTLPADVAPAYEHGHAVASNVPGLLIDPFGFQAAKIVGKAAKDLYDSPAVKKARQDVADLWNAAALKSAPKLTRSNRQLGEAGVRYASSFMVGRTKGQIFADKVLADSGIDPVKFGTALAEDNLRSIRAARDPAQAAKVRTLVGDETSPFKTEAEYQAFLNDPATKAAIERHQQLWAEQKDPLYRQANDLDPDLPLETRGMQTGARINLKALQPGEAGVAPIGQRAPGFRQLATLKRRDPFGQQAKGSGLAYEGNYHEIMANGFERELPVAAQHEFLKQLIDNGDAVVTDKMVEPELELKGEGTAKGYLLTLKPYTGKFIHVRKGLADEFEAISGLDKPLKLPIITAFNNFMTRQSVAGLAEGATHASNLMTQIFTMPGPTGNPMLNALLKSVGRADLLVSVPRVFIKAFTNQREHMLELAEIGAAKEPYPGAIAKKILNPIDQGVRLVSDDVFKALAKKGIVEGTETNRREFINQVGQYNKRLQPLLTRKLRETGLQPFITAAQTFNAQGARRLVMGPGAKAINNARALALKADVAAGWIGGIVLVTALNLLLSKKATGPVGTPLGSVGWIGDDKKVHTFNVFRLLGYERGARITGVGPYIEAKRQGLSSGQALTAGAQSVASTGLGMAMGPGPRFAMVAGTGQRPTQPWVREAPRVPPSDSLSPLKSQIAKNIQTAMVEANPILSSVAEVRKEVKQGKPLSEALIGGAQKQLTRYSPQTRMSEQKAAALPKIVDSAQLRDYVDDVVKEARQLPMRERQHFINQKFRDDELGRKYRDTAWQQIERKGVLKYK